LRTPVSRHLFSLTLCVLLVTSSVAAEPRQLGLSAVEESAICQIATDEPVDSAARPLRHSTRQSEGRDQAVYLANEWLKLAFDGRNGSLIQIHDTVTDHAHLIDRGEERSGFWNFKATAKSADENADNNHKTNVLIAPGNASSFRWEKSNDEGKAIRLIWTDFGLPAAADLAVEVHVKLDGHVPASAWRLTIRSPARLSVEEIHFPIVSGIAHQDDEVLAVPHWMGEKLANPRHLLAGRKGAGRRLQWSYPGHLSLQCVAYYRDNGPGLYTACHDATCQRKSFAIWGDKNSQVHTEIVHYPEFRARSSDECDFENPQQDHVALGYPVVLGTFRGDWLTAAERYREWAVQQAWARESRLAKGTVPDWVLQTGLWVWNRGRSPGVLAPAAALQEQLGLPVSVFWHWWHGCPYDTGFPEYLPPREGTDAFRGALAEAQRKNIRALVYMNQRLWGMTTKSWTEENAVAFAVKGPAGQVRPEVYNTFTRQPCASMCMGTAFWRNKYAGLAVEAVRDLGVDGIYMDQACSSLPCYDPTHGHPLGAGNFWTEGFRLLADDIRRRCGAARKPALAGEGCGEPWLTELDLMLTLQVSRERYAGIQDGWEVIPFFHAVYHPFAILYGNYSSLTIPPYDDLWPAEFAPARPLQLLERKYSGQFYLEQARAFVWGQQPTIANFQTVQLQERSKEIEYVLRLARLRKRAEDYLVRGTFLRPPTLDAPAILLDFSRLSIYAGQRDRVRSFRKSSPSALAAAWRAPNGNIGIALASIVDRPLELSIGLDTDSYGLAHDARIERIDEAGRSNIGSLDPKQPTFRLKLGPLEACVLDMQAFTGR
jgi:hypothetical protein